MKITVEYLDIYSGIVRALTNVNASGLWDDVGGMMDRATNDIFDSEGGAWGVEKWLPLSSKMYGKIRRGTDGKQYGFYNEGSRLLQASGKFRGSFRTIAKRPLSMSYGSNYRFNTSRGQVRADIIPYAGRGQIKARDASPNIESGRFRAELGKIETRFITAIIAKAAASAGKVRT